MIDKMIRCKDLVLNDQIGSLNEWFYKCPPKGKEIQWKDGKSAKETAKHWVYTIPQPFKDILKDENFKYKICSPEYITSFDPYTGGKRNHDLLIVAENKKKELIIISIESKVDEEFDKTISQKIEEGNEILTKNTNSKLLNRIEELRKTLFSEVNDNQLELRYQLLTAVAGTIAEAKKQNAKKCFLLIQTFKSDEINVTKYNKNQEDLNKFIKKFSKEKYSKILDKELIGPFNIYEDTKYLSKDIELWIGKYIIEI
jgi:hypothetical protein